MKLYWCRITPWQRDPESARAFCRRAGIDFSAIWDDRDLAAHAAGRYLLSCAWGETFSNAPMPPITQIGEGKPAIANDVSFHWNISHAGNLAVCAVASVPVGVDVEEIVPVDADLWQRLPDAEQDWCRGESAAFFTLWTAKESLVKSRGEGLSALLALPPLVRCGRVRHRVGDRQWRPVDIDSAYAAAVAAAELPPEIQTEEIQLPGEQDGILI